MEITNIKTIATSLLLVAISFAQGQKLDKNKTLTKEFKLMRKKAKKDHKAYFTNIGFHVATDQYLNGKTLSYDQNDSPIIFQPYTYTSLSIGFSAFVIRKKRYNLKLGFRGNWMMASTKQIYENGQTNFDNVSSWGTYTGGGRWWKWGIPVTFEYKTNKKFNLFVSAIPSRWKRRENFEPSNFLGIGELINYDGSGVDNFFFDTQIGFSYYIPTRFMLVQPFLYYNKSFRTMMSGDFHYNNLKNRPYTQINGIFEHSGDHVSFGFNFYFKKN